MSQIFRVFEPTIYANNSSLLLSEENHHIVARVLRKEVGDTIELVNGNGQIAEAKLETMGKKTSEVAIIHVKEFQPIKPSIRLLVGSLKGEKLSWVVQKSTELGINEIGFFNSDHSVAQKSESFLDKLNKTAIEAIRQSGNPFLPKTLFYPSLQDLKFCTDTNHWNIVLDEASNFPVSKILHEAAPIAITIFIGPEGGLSREEKIFLQAQNCRMVRIAPYILRADTAAITAAALFRTVF